MADVSACLSLLFFSLSSMSWTVGALLLTFDFVGEPFLADGPPVELEGGGESKEGGRCKEWNIKAFYWMNERMIDN